MPIASIRLVCFASVAALAAAAAVAPARAAEDINAGSLTNSPPLISYAADGTTLQGMIVDLAAAMSRQLGRTIVFKSMAFPAIIPALEAKSIDIAFTVMNDTTTHPRLIVCNVSGYGSAGPYANRKAYDLLIQSEVGLLAITGTPNAPAKVGISVADIAAGMYAYSGILTALIKRGATGGGSTVDVSLFDALGEWMGYAAYYAAYGGSAPPASGAHHASIAPYGPFRAGDGHVVYLAVQNGREWARFCAAVLDQPELADDTRFSDNAARVRHRTALHEIIHDAFAGLSAADVSDRLNRADIANARLNSVHGFLEHAQLSARHRWADIGSPAGPLRTLIPPVDIDGVDPHLGDVPALGQHTDAILTELGVDAATIAAWRKEGTI